MSNEIELKKREMYDAMQNVRRFLEGKSLFEFELFEGYLEDYLEELRQAYESKQIIQPAKPETPSQAIDEVNNPSHYTSFPGMESIDVIEASLTPEEFLGFLKGNFLEYKYRSGEKGSAEKCIAKVNWYADRARRDSDNQEMAYGEPDPKCIHAWVDLGLTKGSRCKKCKGWLPV